MSNDSWARPVSIESRGSVVAIVGIRRLIMGVGGNDTDKAL